MFRILNPALLRNPRAGLHLLAGLPAVFLDRHLSGGLAGSAVASSPEQNRLLRLHEFSCLHTIGIGAAWDVGVPAQIVMSRLSHPFEKDGDGI